MSHHGPSHMPIVLREYLCHSSFVAHLLELQVTFPDLRTLYNTAKPRSSSPARKRQRLSSPTYDDQVEDLTQEDLAAFDAIEAQLSQAHNLNTGKPQGQWGSGSSQPQEPLRSSFLKASNLKDDPDNPFSSTINSGKTSEKRHFPMPPIAFASASNLLLSAQGIERSPSPEVPHDASKFDDWFQSASAAVTPAFTIPNVPPITGMLGFAKASNKGIIMPSKEALAKAKARIDTWNKEFVEPDAAEQENALDLIAPALETRSRSGQLSGNPPTQSPMRMVFQTVSNANEAPSTPSPAAFSRPSLNTSPATPYTLYRPKPFKTPFLRQHHTSNSSIGSPLNPQRPSISFTSAAHHPHPLAAPPISASMGMPSVPSNLTTPFRKNNTPIGRTTPAPFKTPFKIGFRPPLVAAVNYGSPQLKNDFPAVKDNRIIHESVPRNTPSRKQFFCLTSQTERKTLASSGLRPQQYDVHELEELGIDGSMLSQITPDAAKYYNFLTTSSTPLPTSSAMKATLGPTEALKELLQRGCTLATQPWVDNHWCLIIWKLAGMVALDPISETKTGETRWCWSEVINQLLYRYERELHGGSRPPLRKIANQDAPAAFPMVLCISNILWSPAGMTEDGIAIPSFPELELTDGWYRLRAQVDLPMARAVRRGIIRIGRKLGFAGARLSTEKKDPTEILEAYNATHLILSGNSSHLMPWHTKLGFTHGPCISTLHSLTADGGAVAALDFVITKLYPIAFLEFIEDENGNKERIGPRNEAEELEVNERWKKRYEMEASKLRAEHDKKFSRYAGYADRLERKAGSHFQRIKGSDGYPPDQIDSMYDELEYPDTAANVISHITSTDAAWLALHIQRQNEKDRELIGEDIEKELRTICPPRDIRSFRILIIQDARTCRRPANRTAQLTVWDVLSLSLDEGSQAGAFEIGQRFMATNLIPQQQSAWMDCAPGSEVYLSTRRDTRWTRIKKTV